MESKESVLYEVRDAIARITLNRPEKRNALNAEIIEALKVALRRANHDQGVCAVILIGAGSDFCSGADLQTLQKISSASVSDNLEDVRSLMEVFTLIRQLHVPVIAAVRGRALAGGCGLATACDLVLAERSARFGYPEVKIGFVPAMVTAILRRNVSEKKAYGSSLGSTKSLVNNRFGVAGRGAASEFPHVICEERARLRKLLGNVGTNLLPSIDGVARVQSRFLF